MTYHPPLLPDQDAYEAIHHRTEIWDRFVAHVVEQCDIEHALLRRVSGGSNLLYALDAKRLIKLYPAHYRDDAMIEIEALRAARRAELGVTLPEIERHGLWREWSWAVIARIPGVIAISPPSPRWREELSAEDRRRVIGELGAWMRRSWESVAFQSARLPARWSDSLATQARLREVVGSRQRRCGAGEWREPIEAYLEGWSPIDESIVMHADLHGRNILLDADDLGGWHLNGVIDFGDTLRAPRLYDLVPPLIYLVQGDPQLAEILYQRTLGPNYDLDQRTMMQWVLLHRFSNLRYMLEELPHLNAQRLNTLDEIAACVTCL